MAVSPAATCRLTTTYTTGIEEIATDEDLNAHSISHYWGMVKDMDDSQKLQLITFFITG